MKKATVLMAGAVLVAATISSADAPVDVSSMIVGGEVDIKSQGGDLHENNDGDGRTSIEFSYFLAYFCAPSIAVGGEISASSSSRGDYSGSSFGIGPTIAYYFNLDAARTEVKGTIYPYVQAFFKYGSSKSSWEPDDDFKSRITYVGGKSGIIYMVTDHWAVNANIYYQSENYKQIEPEVLPGDDESKSGNTLGFKVGITAFLY